MQRVATYYSLRMLQRMEINAVAEVVQFEVRSKSLALTYAVQTCSAAISRMALSA